MTVIAWDGKTLAADKQVTYSNVAKTSTKIHRVNDCLIGFSGPCGTAGVLMDWFKNGEKIEDWPHKLMQTDDWANLIVVEKDRVRWYDRQPYFIQLEDPFMAWGGGTDFALGAMAAGANAIQAVEIAIRFCEGCGRGIDCLTIGGEI